MTANGELIPVSEPGEVLPEGASFLEIFGASLSDVDIDRLRGSLDRIDENERRTALLSRNIIIGNSPVQSVKYPGERVAKGALSDSTINEDRQSEFEAGLSEISSAEREAEVDLNIVLRGEKPSDIAEPHNLSPRALGILKALYEAHEERELQRAIARDRPRMHSGYILAFRRVQKYRPIID